MFTSALILLSVPLLFTLAALLLRLPETSSTARFDLSTRWRLLRGATHLAPALTALAGLAQLLDPNRVVARFVSPDASEATSFLSWVTPSLSVRVDALSFIMLALVTVVAMVITRFSQRYLDGEPGQPRYQSAFALTMAAVSLLVITNNLLVLVCAWTVSSFSLHQLLTFYRDRPAALVAAHKKFLMSRLADLFLFGAVGVLYLSLQTLELDVLTQRALAGQAPHALLELAGGLLACGVILRSAQLPFHGWLIQVMEAPTPVSALLHAGVVNIGGFVLIRLGALLLHLEVAQTLLVFAGGLTAALAALIMTTRVSVKVGLAWSTCAQMGFMLMECGLGAYELALLHLVAHSLYKAHAFLSSGRTVAYTVRGRAASAPGNLPVMRWVLVFGATLPTVLLVDATLSTGLGASLQGLAAGFIVALALTSLLVRAQPSQASGLALIVVALAALLGYLGLHVAFGRLLAFSQVPTFDVWSLVRFGLVLLLFSASFALHAALRAAPHGAVARRVYPSAYAGFYLDELFTRLTFALWPPRGLGRPAAPLIVPSTSSVRSVA